jgi:arylsulfatase A-like enzyme
VPLLILLPARRPAGAVVRRTVSLRDLPATVVDLIDLEEGAPFPGRSLARLWADGLTGDPPVEIEAALCELASPNPADPNQRRSPVYRGPLVSLAEGDFVYIRNDGDGVEELFNQRDDPEERSNLARAEGMLPVLRRFRDHLRRARSPSPAVGEAGVAARVAVTPKSP